MKYSTLLFSLSLSFMSCGSLFHHERSRYKPGQSYVCGDNVTWLLTKDGEMTIEGTGMMGDFHDVAPWFSYRDRIKKVKIKEGVTSIGNESFKFCTHLSSVTIPNSVTSIGEEAFFGCGEALFSINFPGSVTSIGEGAISGCTSLTSVIIPSGVTNIQEAVFRFCSSLSSITIPNSVKSIESDAFPQCM